jgi:hypothetical protein
LADKKSVNPHLILPLGTQVVARVEVKRASGEVLCPRGAVGVIVKAPVDHAHSYLIRFVNGVEAALRRNEIIIRKHSAKASWPLPADALAEEEHNLVADLYAYVVYRCVGGARAYGLEEAWCG